jgi:lipopolysaccharide transport system permease protein
MYATPVIYPLKTAPAKIKAFISLNPLSPLIEGLRLGTLGKGDFNVHSFIYSTITVFVLAFFGILIFNKTEKNFIDTV